MLAGRGRYFLGPRKSAGRKLRNATPPHTTRSVSSSSRRPKKDRVLAQCPVTIAGLSCFECSILTNCVSQTSVAYGDGHPASPCPKSAMRL